MDAAESSQIGPPRRHNLDNCARMGSIHHQAAACVHSYVMGRVPEEQKVTWLDLRDGYRGRPDLLVFGDPSDADTGLAP
jgi:hypothetical protein